MADIQSMFGGLLDGYGEFLNPTAASVPQGAAYDAETLRAARMALLGNLSGSLLAAGQPGPIGQRAQMLAKIGDAPTAYNETLQGGVRMQAAKIAMDKARQDAADAERFRNTDLSTMGLTPAQATLLKALPADTRATVLGQLLTKDSAAPQIFGSDKTGYYSLDRKGNKVQLVPGAGPDNEKLASGEHTLRTEFTGNEAVKSFNQAQRSYEAMSQMVDRANKGVPGAGVNDTALVYAFFKTIDPTSTVREGEFATVAANMGLADKIITAFQKVDGKGFLTPEIRKELAELAGTYMEKQYGDIETLKQQYQTIAKGRGLNPDFVTPDPRRPWLKERMELLQAPPEKILQMTPEQLQKLPIERMSPAQIAAARQRALQLKGGGR